MDDDQFRKLLDYFHFSWKGYRKVRKGVKKRIGRHMQLIGCRTMPGYIERIDANPTLRDECERAMTVSISRFFRDRDLWGTLEEDVFPEIETRGLPVIRAWSAGCAGGEEVYSLKVVHQYLLQSGICRTPLRILATDLIQENIDRAKTGVFPASSLRDIPGRHRNRYFDAIPRRRYAVLEEITSNIQWQCHHLLTEPPGTGFHMLFLRNNLLTYYRDHLKIPAFEQISETLCPSGYLIIDAHEKLPESEYLFVRHPRHPHIFQKQP